MAEFPLQLNDLSVREAAGSASEAVWWLGVGSVRALGGFHSPADKSLSCPSGKERGDRRKENVTW